jgi:hypothetical protein
MRNKILLSSVLLACATSATYAGDMGPVESYPFKPFILGEAAYSWPQVSGLSVNSNLGYIGSTQTVQGWGGRLAAGLMRHVSEKFALSFEGGLMYNDHITIDPVVHAQGANISVPGLMMGSFDQYGLDLLAGINYVKPKYDIFFKAGALFENMRTQVSVNTNKILYNNDRQNYFIPTAQQTINTNIGQVMPEIKLGGAYHVNEDWSLTAAWMHAFGGTLSMYSDQMNLTSGSISIGNIALSLNNPTIDSVLFGVQYSFN